MKSILTLFLAGVLVLPAFSDSREFSADLNAGGQVDWVGVSQKQQVPYSKEHQTFFPHRYGKSAPSPALPEASVCGQGI